MTGRPFIGLSLAVIVEAAHWIKLRWDFDDKAVTRSWHLSVIALAAVTALIWLEGNRYTALSELFGWLPPLLLPVQFVQSYGVRPSIALTTFSFFARQRRERNQRLGLEESTVRFHFGNAYLVTILLSSTLGNTARDHPRFYLAGLLLLSVWAVYGSQKRRSAWLLLAFLLAAAIAVAGQIALRITYQRLSDGSGRGRSDYTTSSLISNHHSTRIGKLEEIKQSPQIFWRLRPLGNHPPPRLLRTVSYDFYERGIWKNYLFPSASEDPSSTLDDTEFADLTTLEPVLGQPYYLLRPDADQQAFRPALPRFNLRGGAKAYTAFPLPGSASSLSEFQLDGIERNPLGTVRIFPKESVVSGTVIWRDTATPDSPPSQAKDLLIVPEERETIRQIASQLRLAEAPTLQAKLDLLNRYFLDFEYTRYLSISPPTRDEAPTAISVFLTNSRAGHCEYFATAAALLLREAGVPARYAIGFAIAERDAKRNEFVVRGIHGHAWCRVWDEANRLWVDFDPTPPSWNAREMQRTASDQWVSDLLLRLREDFLIWRGQPQNRLIVTLSFAAAGVAGFAFILRKLWLTRRRVPGMAQRSYWSGPVPETPLHPLEKRAQPFLGPRPVSQPLAQWLLQLRPRLPDPAVLEEALLLHQRLRFDPHSPAAAPLQERLAALAKALERTLRSLPRRR